IVKHKCPSYAIGELNGDKDKDQFQRIVTLSTEYSMNVSFAIDLLRYSALDCDMFDCGSICITNSLKSVDIE
ncbi:unnamed protein product, partial [Adineta steineri]